MAHHPFQGIDFTDQRGEIAGYARGWFFWVFKGFKSALGISYAERINKEKTKAMRDNRAVRLGYESLDDFRAKLKQSDIALGKHSGYQAIMRHAVRDGIEIQGSPPLYEFRATDGLESRCGRWYVQVSQASPDKSSRADKEKCFVPGSVGFQIFERAQGATSDAIWRKQGFELCSQAEFASLLQHGFCSSLQLAPSMEPTAALPSTEAQSNLFQQTV